MLDMLYSLACNREGVPSEKIGNDCTVKVEPAGGRSDDIHDKGETSSRIGGREPGAGEGVSQVGGDGGHVKEVAGGRRRTRSCR